MPTMWLVAGPNGSGKSTLVKSAAVRAITFGAVFVNPDDIALQMAEARHEPLSDDINLEAARLVEARVAGLIEAGDDFLVETVLSTEKYLKHIESARGRNYRIGLLFVCSASPEQTNDRVRQRVQTGGHDVPAEKAAARWFRSIRNLLAFGRLVDVGVVFDNSNFGGPPRVVAQRAEQGWVRRQPCRIAALDDVIADLVGNRD